MGEIENFPKNIGRYEIKSLLGAGAMGAVYLAEDPRIKRKLAIKVVKMDSIRSEADRKEFLARFQREAEVSGLLNDPGIVTIYDVGDGEMGPFLAMEYVAGRTLEGLLKSGEPLPLGTKLTLAASIAKALDHAHSNGIVHRDVKPGNVMVTEDFRAKLMDFGIAKREDASLTQTGTFLGTPSYASPEQIREGVATAQSDVFSFGVLVFELLSGSLPFPGTSINTILYRIVNEPPVTVVPPVEGLVSEGWQRVFEKVLAKHPEDRHGSCSAFVRELLETTIDLGKTDRMQLLAGLKPVGGSHAPASPGPETGSPGRAADATVMVTPLSVSKPSRNPLIGAAALGVVAVLAGGLLLRKGGSQVLLDTVPPNAAVVKDGKELGRTPFPLTLRPGESVDIERKGFQSQNYTFHKGDAAPKIQLNPVMSDETLRTDPAGATVVMDEVPLAGVTPLVVKGWNQGRKHALNFKKGNLVQNFDLLEGEVPGNRVFTLAAAAETREGAMPKAVDANAPGQLKLSGEFPVRVKLDGKDLGELHPGASVPAAPGAHHLELSNPKVFCKESHQLTVKPGQAQTVVLPALVHLTVETYPSSGQVLVDGILTAMESDGSSPISLVKGRHTIAIQGHSGTQKSVDVEGDTVLPRFKL